MKLKYLIVLLIIFSGCEKKKVAANAEGSYKISERLNFQTARGELKVNSGKFRYHFPLEKLPLNRVVVLNASLIGYLAELGVEDKIVGVSSPEYIFSEEIHRLLASGKIAEVGNEQKYNVEKIAALKPDLIITNHISTFENTYAALRQITGAEILFLDEYLETRPLDKTKYLLLFGKLFRKEQQAASLYNKIANNYAAWSEKAKALSPKPLVIANEMYGNQWFMPGGKTQLAQLIADAGGNYILSNENSQKAVPMSFEEVLVKSAEASIWLNAGNHMSKSSLLAVNANYSKLAAFKKGKVYSVTAKQKQKANDFFESGVVRADLVLRDYIKILHPQVFPKEPSTYMSEIK